MPTPFMNLDLPIVGVTIGPTWATMLNDALTLVDTHDHSPGKGVPIGAAGLDIANDLSLQGTALAGNNLTDVRTVRFESQGAPLGAISTDRRAIYAVANELYYTDSTGAAVRITLGGAVDVSGAGSITGMGGTTAAVTYSNVTKTFSFVQAAATPAKLDAGDIRIAEDVLNGKGPVLQAAAGTVADYDFIFPAALPISTLPLQLSAAGVLSTAQIPTAGIVDLSVTTAKIADLNVTTAKLAAAAVTFEKVAAGMVVGYARAVSGATVTSLTNMPSDDTIPQVGEGSQVMTLGYTPKKIGNKLKIVGIVNVAATSAVGTRTVVRGAGALFKDGAADALAGATLALPRDTTNSISGSGTLTLDYEETVASLAAATWTMRVGQHNDSLEGVWTVSNDNLGGLNNRALTIMEIAQ